MPKGGSFCSCRLVQVCEEVNNSSGGGATNGSSVDRWFLVAL